VLGDTENSLENRNSLGRQFGRRLWERYGEDTILHCCLNLVLLETRQYLRHLKD